MYKVACSVFIRSVGVLKERTLTIDIPSDAYVCELANKIRDDLELKPEEIQIYKLSSTDTSLINDIIGTEGPCDGMLPGATKLFDSWGFPQTPRQYVLAYVIGESHRS